jgi:hypothetical protein
LAFCHKGSIRKLGEDFSCMPRQTTQAGFRPTRRITLGYEKKPDEMAQGLLIGAIYVGMR